MSIRTDHPADEIHCQPHPVTLFASNPPQHHTHLQQVAGCPQADLGGGPGC